jgi:predicted nucleotidyltransferase
LRQLARDGGISAPGLLKELTHFHELRLVCKEERNGRTNYYANRQSALFLVLCELVEKAEGLHEKLRRMLSNLKTDCIFIFGSEANGTARPDSDIDIFVIGCYTLGEISEALLPAADLTNREINPILYSRETFRGKCMENNHFVRNVLQSPMIFLKGGRHELERLGR